MCTTGSSSPAKHTFRRDCSMRRCDSHDTDLSQTVSMLGLNESPSLQTQLCSENTLSEVWICSFLSFFNIPGEVRSGTPVYMEYHLISQNVLFIWTGSFSSRDAMQLWQHFWRLCWQTVLPWSLLIETVSKSKSRWDLNAFTLSVLICLSNKKHVEDFPVFLLITQRCISNII